MRRREIFGSTLAGSVILLAWSGQAAALGIKNPSFEIPIAPDNGVLQFNHGQKVGKGWRVTGDPNGNVFVVGKNFVRASHAFPAKNGNQWLCLTGSANLKGGVSQLIVTVPGQKYQLSFWVGNINDPGDGFGTTSAVLVQAAGQHQKFVNKSTSADFTWEQFTFTFTASENSTMIKFINEDPSTDGINGLDDVGILAVPTH